MAVSPCLQTCLGIAGDILMSLHPSQIPTPSTSIAISLLHYLRHVTACWRRFMVVLSCFAPERKHKLAKRLGNYCYNRMTTSLIAHDLQSVLAKVCEKRAFEGTHLLPPTKPWGDATMLLAYGAGAASIFGANAMMTLSGQFHKGRVSICNFQFEFASKHFQLM